MTNAPCAPLTEADSVPHVTFPSGEDTDQAPPRVALRAVELDLIGRGAITHAILRPAWFMQNFSESSSSPLTA